MRLSRSPRTVLTAIAMAVLVAATGTGVVARQAETARANAEAAALPRPFTPIVHVDYVRVGVIGDSYTAGSEMGGNGSANWVRLVGAKLLTAGHPIETFVSAIGGSGYVERGPTNTVFADLQPVAVDDSVQVVVVFGSRNDAGVDGVQDAATALYKSIAKRSPKAKLLVIGPPWTSEDVPAKVLIDRDQTKAAATSAGATFLDPIAGRWFFGADSKLIGSDGIHPTDAGHSYMADRILPQIEAMVVAA